MARPNPSTPVPRSAAAVASAAAAAAAADSTCDNLFVLFSLLGLFFLTFNSIISVIRSIHDPSAVAFISFTYVNLLLLYYSMYLIDCTPAGDVRRRNRLKAAMWALCSTLTVMVFYRAASIMPLVISVFIWALSAVIVVGGFYALFVSTEKPENEGKNADVYDKC